MSSKEIELLTLAKVSRAIGLGYYQESKLQEWIDDPKLETPASHYKVNGDPMWTKDTLPEWKALWDKVTQRERELEEELTAAARSSSYRLQSETMGKASIIEHLLNEAKTLARRNSGCRTHNRGNSMSDGRRRVVEFEGMQRFVYLLLGDLKIPKEKKDEISELYIKAKQYVQMQ
jgi:hypothetical protein